MTENEKSLSLPQRIPAFGLVCAFLSIFCFSLQSLIVKVLQNVHTIEILVIRSLFQYVFYAAITLHQKQTFFCESDQRFNLFMRSLMGTSGSFCAFMSFRLIPLSDASTIQFSSPVFVVIIARLMLNEPITKIKCLTSATSILGVFILAKPEFVFGFDPTITIEHRVEGIGLAVVSALGMAFATIYIRKLKSAPTCVIVMWHSLVSIIAGSVLLYTLNAFVLPRDYISWFILIAIGVLGICGQFLLTTALKHEGAGPVSVTNTLTIVLAFVWEIILFHESPQSTSFIGAILVSSSVIILALDKWHTEKPDLFAPCLGIVRCYRSKTITITRL